MHPTSVRVQLSDRVVFLYILLVVFAFSGAIIKLASVRETRLKSLSNAVLFYLGKDSNAKVFAFKVQANTHINIVDMQSTGAGTLVNKLLGTNEATSPSLIIRRGSVTEVYSGYASVDEVLQDYLGTNGRIQKARSAVMIMFLLIILALFNYEFVTSVASYLPVVGLLSASALYGGCLTCQVGTSKMASLVPLLVLILLGCSVALFTFPYVRSKGAFQLFGVLAAATPVVQSMLLIIEPKMCVFCMTLTFVFVSLALSSYKTLLEGHLSGLSVPKYFSPFICVTWIVLVTRAVLILAGRIDLTVPEVRIASRFVGSSLNHYLRYGGASHPGVLLMVTLPGCHVCEAAERDLKKSGIVFTNVPVCTNLSSECCFAAEDAEFPTPLFLLSNKENKIIYQHEGWNSSPAEVNAIFAEIRNLQRRNMN